jgi:hypothetical protein
MDGNRMGSKIICARNVDDSLLAKNILKELKKIIAVYDIESGERSEKHAAFQRNCLII